MNPPLCLSEQPETTVKGRGLSSTNLPAAPGDPDTLQGTPHTSRSKRILSHSQAPACHLRPVPAGAPTKKDTGTITVWGAWKRPSGCPHSDNAPMPRRSVVPTGFSPSPPDPSHRLSQRCTGGLGQESPPDCLSSEAGVHPTGAPMHSPHPMSGTQPQRAGGNPIDRADAARAQRRQSWGRKHSPFPPNLCRGARAHPTRSHGPGLGAYVPRG